MSVWSCTVTDRVVVTCGSVITVCSSLGAWTGRCRVMCVCGVSEWDHVRLCVCEYGELVTRWIGLRVVPVRMCDCVTVCGSVEVGVPVNVVV